MAVRERTCLHCGGQFRYEIGRGNDRKHCSPECASAHARDLARARPAAGMCAADGCEKPTRSSGCSHCEMHYMRLRRRGEIDRRPLKGWSGHSGGYRVRHVQNHPLETPGSKGRVYEHRVVFHAEHGDGPFACHHCGVTVTWADMDVDHLNDTKDDNDPGNLVASCPPCNKARGQWKMIAASRARGRQITAFGRTMCLAEWSKECGLPSSTLTRRLADGWDVDVALETPSGPTGRKTAAARARRHGLAPEIAP